jgi:hypothetical protein
MSIGIEWVNNYHGRPGLANLSNNDDNAKGFYNTLQGVKQFQWSDDWAWDQDFEESQTGTPQAGGDQYWADNVDICFFSGHGSPNGPLFGVTAYDDGQTKPTESRLGNRQLEWVIFDACQVLQYDNGAVFNRWGWSVFKGLHYILGFHTTTGDSATRGQKFAEKLNAGWTVRTAWIRACEETEGSGTQWAYLRANSSVANTYDDHWWGKGSVSADPANPTSLAYLRGTC